MAKRLGQDAYFYQGNFSHGKMHGAGVL